MIHCVEEFGDVALYKPARASPCGLDFLQGCMASSAWAEPVGVLTHLRFVVRFENGAHDFLQELILPGGQSERSLTSFLLWNVDTSYWRPSVALMTNVVNEPFDFCH